MSYRISDECISCGACELNCPAGAISNSEEEGHFQIDPDKCVSCGMCASVCPLGAPKVD